MVYESVVRIPESLSELLNDAVLKRFVSLQALAVETGISDEGLRTATNLTMLVLGIHVNDKRITDDGIAGLTKLTTLRLSSTITDNGLKNLTNLTMLELNTAVTDDAITKLMKLTTLDAWDSAVTAVGLKALTNLTRLSVDSDRRNYDDAISQLTNLVHLYFGGNPIQCVVSDKTLKCLTNLTSLHIGGEYFIDLGIENLTNLRILNLSEMIDTANKFTDYRLKNLCNLTSLDIRYNSLITDAAISGLTNLSHLEVSADGVTDAGIRNLVHLTRLVAGNAITDSGISNLTNLIDLDVGEKLTNAGIRGLTKLKYLSLDRNDTIDDAGISELTNLTDLFLGRETAISYGVVTLLTKLRILNRNNKLGFEQSDDERVFRDLPSLSIITGDLSPIYREEFEF